MSVSLPTKECCVFSGWRPLNLKLSSLKWGGRCYPGRRCAPSWFCPRAIQMSCRSPSLPLSSRRGRQGPRSRPRYLEPVLTRQGKNSEYARSLDFPHYWLISFFLSFFYFICSEFCHTLEWNSHGFTYVPHPDSPSHLPLHPLPLGLPSAPGPSACLMHPTWAGDLFHPRYYTCFDAVLLKHPTLCFTHRV